MGEVWLGDLVRALVALRAGGDPVDAGLAGRVRRMLDLDVSPAPGEPAPRLRAVPVDPPGRPAAGPDPLRAPTPAPDPAPSRAAPAGGGGQVVQRLWTDPPHRPWQTARVLPRADARAVVPVPHTPLFRPRATAAIVHEMCARALPDGDVDVDRLVAALARQHPVTGLPLRTRRTLRFGVHLVLDRGEAMYPFHADQRHLGEVVREVVGRDVTKTTVVVDTPRNVRAGERLPEPGRPVVVVSGFGIRSGTARVADWQRYAAALRDRGSPPVALVPFPRHRLPGWLCALMPVVVWDRDTTARAVRVGVGRWP
ncbi:hypothetical protein AB0I60_20480 [Actinosynnema sp. NPDC050436]|uniref:hypothetical protein n=1 Tax=Actinosynnema sp. NPDC050436 TaxID=3155659 RepID=UPI0033C94E53